MNLHELEDMVHLKFRSEPREEHALWLRTLASTMILRITAEREGSPHSAQAWRELLALALKEVILLARHADISVEDLAREVLR